MTRIDYAELTFQLKALADPTRLEILRMLQLNRGGFTVVEITHRLGRLKQPTISHHLKQLHEAGLVRSKRNGVWVRYTIADGALGPVLDALSRLS